MLRLIRLKLLRLLLAFLNSVDIKMIGYGKQNQIDSRINFNLFFMTKKMDKKEANFMGLKL